MGNIYKYICIYAGHQVPHGYAVPLEEEQEEQEAQEQEEEEEEEEKRIAVTTSIFKNSC